MSCRRQDFHENIYYFQQFLFRLQCNNIKPLRRTYFLLCNSCFWCASYIDVDKRVITDWPCCNNAKLESMPISDKEVYKFEYHPNRGVTLEFLKIVEKE